MSVFVRDQVERDGELDLPYVLAELTNLFAAGNGTTAHMLASALLLLLENPEQLERARADRTLLRPVIEEAIRLESPSSGTSVWSRRTSSSTESTSPRAAS